MTTIAFGPTDAVPGRLDRVARDWGTARELGLRIHAHAGLETSDRGLVADLAGRDLLGRDVTLVHCTNLEDPDLDAVASTGTSVSLAPSTEMAGGIGPPPLQQLIDRGIRPGLGVDDEQVTPGDMFTQMRAAISIQHATVFDLKLAGKGGLPRLLTTREVILYATADGARVAGLGDVTGSLEPASRPTSSCCAPTGPTSHRSTTRSERSSGVWTPQTWIGSLPGVELSCATVPWKPT